jgi:hypothetical protein
LGGRRSNEIINNSDLFVKREQEELGSWRSGRDRESQPWTGIALSGGGIRSATFCLGVLQALANKNHLKHFDYISTVSGGGYIGCALQWWWHQPPSSNHKNPDKTSSEHKIGSKLGTSRSNFPFGNSEPGAKSPKRDDAESWRLKRLREHANYLAPGGGISYWSGVAAILRAMALNLLVWIPLISFLFFFFRLLGRPFSALDKNLFPFVPEHASVVFEFALLLVTSAIVVFLATSTIYSMTTTHEEGEVTRYSVEYTLLSVLAGLIAYLLYKFEGNPYIHSLFILTIVLAVIFLAKAISKWTSVLWSSQGLGEAYRYRLIMDRGFGRFFPFFILLVVFSLLPFVFEYVSVPHAASATVPPATPGTKASLKPDFLLGLFSVGTGAAASLWGYYQLFRNYWPTLATSVFLPLGGALFLFGVALLGYYFGVSFYYELSSYTSADISTSWHRRYALFISFNLFCLAILSAFMVNLNQISLNRFYRDRLMEAFMPDKDSKNIDKRQASGADTLLLSELWPQDWVPPGPYPLINTNVVLVNDGKPKYRLRGGDNFVLTPYFCGSEATGWSRTKEAFPNISLATCMAASAAAVNPFSGYVGTGPTRNRIVSIVMALLNLRLGVWVRNPAKRLRYITYRQPDHIVPGALYAFPGRGHCSNSHFLELTDGGHFDNLGLYELVRRKCKVILVCDGEMDKKTSYAALVSIQRRIKDDFGAHIVFHPHEGPELLIESTLMDYPSGALMANQTFFVADIVYNDKHNNRGKIIYIKARMIEQLSFEVRAYKGAHMDFPHESTEDQFFDPEQFDAHFELGYQACLCADSTMKSILKSAAHLPTTSAEVGTRATVAKPVGGPVRQ